MDEGAGKPRQDEIKMEQSGETSPKEETKGLSGGDQVTKDGTKEEQSVEKVAESGKEGQTPRQLRKTQRIHQRAHRKEDRKSVV